MGNVREDVAKLFSSTSEEREISLELLDVKTSSDAVSLEFLDKPVKTDDKNNTMTEFLDAPSANKEDYISLDLLDKTASLMCEHLSIRALECNVGGFAHTECSNPAFHESCPFKLVHAELRKRKF